MLPFLICVKAGLMLDLILNILLVIFCFRYCYITFPKFKFKFDNFLEILAKMFFWLLAFRLVIIAFAVTVEIILCSYYFFNHTVAYAAGPNELIVTKNLLNKQTLISASMLRTGTSMVDLNKPYKIFDIIESLRLSNKHTHLIDSFLFNAKNLNNISKPFMGALNCYLVSSYFNEGLKNLSLFAGLVLKQNDAPFEKYIFEKNGVFFRDKKLTQSFLTGHTFMSFGHFSFGKSLLKDNKFDIYDYEERKERENCIQNLDTVLGGILEFKKVLSD